jgi:hypothetical protein
VSLSHAGRAPAGPRQARPGSLSLTRRLGEAERACPSQAAIVPWCGHGPTRTVTGTAAVPAGCPAGLGLGNFRRRLGVTVESAGGPGPGRSNRITSESPWHSLSRCRTVMYRQAAPSHWPLNPGCPSPSHGHKRCRQCHAGPAGRALRHAAPSQPGSRAQRRLAAVKRPHGSPCQ